MPGYLSFHYSACASEFFWGSWSHHKTAAANCAHALLAFLLDTRTESGRKNGLAHACVDRLNWQPKVEVHPQREDVSKALLADLWGAGAESRNVPVDVAGKALYEHLSRILSISSFEKARSVWVRTLPRESRHKNAAIAVSASVASISITAS